MKKVIESDALAKPIGPYNHAVLAGELIYTSGQIPLDPANNEVVEGGIKEQTQQVLKNLESVLNAANTSFDNVVKTTVFLKDMNDFAAMNEVYASSFSGSNAPARSTIEVSRLPKDVLVEIEAIATAG